MTYLFSLSNPPLSLSVSLAPHSFRPHWLWAGIASHQDLCQSAHPQTATAWPLSYCPMRLALAPTRSAKCPILDYCLSQKSWSSLALQYLILVTWAHRCLLWMLILINETIQKTDSEEGWKSISLAFGRKATGQTGKLNSLQSCWKGGNEGKEGRKAHLSR